MKTRLLRINNQAQAVASPQVAVLQTTADIEDMLEKSRLLFHPLPVSDVSLDGTGLPEPARHTWEARLNTYLHECGCPAGQFAAASGLLMYVVGLFAIMGTPVHWTWTHILLTIPLCLGLAVIGKLTSQFLARLKLVRGLETLLRMRQIPQTQ
jgi:hypothetical protein